LTYIKKRIQLIYVQTSDEQKLHIGGMDTLNKQYHLV